MCCSIAGAILDHDIDFQDTADDECPSVSSTPQQSVASDSAVEKYPAMETTDTGVEFGPYVRFSRLYEQTCYKEELETIQSTKVICSLDLLLEQFVVKCPSPGCLLTRKMDYSIIGTCAIVRWQCPSGLRGGSPPQEK